MAKRRTALEEHLLKTNEELTIQLAEERKAFMAAVTEIASRFADAVGKFSTSTVTTSIPGVYVDSGGEQETTTYAPATMDENERVQDDKKKDE